MNKWIGIGNLTKDPEAKNTSSGTTFCTFTIAVKRRFKDSNGEYQSDFINCVAWKQTATFISSYFHKGSKIAVVGNIQTRSYEGNDGQKRYVTEVIVDEAEFVESNKTVAKSAPTAPANAPTDPANLYDDEFPTEIEDDTNDTLEF